MKERIFLYDILRTIACIMVIIVHAPHSKQPELYGTYFGFITYTMMAGVSIFFLLSGALILPTKLSTIDFFKRRLNRIFWPIIFWTIIYTIYSFFVENVDFKYLIKNLIGIPFKNSGAPELWFMYELLGVYLIIPIISPYFHKASKKEYEIYLILWIISLCLPYLNLIWPINAHTGIFTYTTGYAGYFLLGAYLHKFFNKSISLKNTIIISIILFLIWAGSLFIAIYFELANKGTMMSCKALPLASLTLMIYLIAKYFSKTPPITTIGYKVITNISSLSFGIYLSHVYISQRLLRNWDWLMNQHAIIEIGLVSLISFLGSWLFSWIVSKSKFSKYIIGC